MGYVHVFIAGVVSARLFILVAVRDRSTGLPVGPEITQLAVEATMAPCVARYGCCFGYLGYALLVICFDLGYGDRYIFLHNGGLLPAMVLVLIGAAIGIEPIATLIFRNRIFLMLGRISYIQYLMQMRVWYFIGRYLSPTGQRVLAIPLLIAWAYFCQRWFERPFTDWQRWRAEKGVLGCDERAIRWLDRRFSKRCSNRFFLGLLSSELVATAVLVFFVHGKWQDRTL